MTENQNNFPEGGSRPNEMAVLTAGQKTNKRGVVGNNYSSDHPRYRELMDEYPPIKEAVLKMQAAIDRSPFKGIIGVGIRESGATFWVYRNYVSERRFLNRVKAYSECYEKLRKHLAPLCLMVD